MRRRVSSAAALLVIAVSMLAPLPCAAQVSASERDALVRLRVDRGGRPEEIDALIRRVDDAAAKGLPVVAVINKIREGLAKGHDPKRIDLVIQQLVLHLETADQLMRDLDQAAGGAGRDASLTLLAESLGSGVSPGEVREVFRLAQASGKPPESSATVTLDRLSGAAKALSFIKEAKLPAREGTAVVAEAVRQGFRSHEIIDLGRGVKLRQADYQSGRASLQALRDAIARGDRPDQLFRDSRPEIAARPAATRPESGVERPERPTRPETPQRPEQPERPVRPERPGGVVR